MKVNIFEGARRIEYLIIAIMIVVGAILAWESEPRLELHYSLPFPNKPLEKSNSTDCNYEDAEESAFRISPKGHYYTIKICFKATHLNNGEVLHPFKKDQKILLNYEFDESAMSYRRQFLDEFHPSSNEVIALEKKYWPSRIWEVVKVLGLTASYVIGFWIFCWIIGWIIRGFLGVPLGKDFKD